MGVHTFNFVNAAIVTINDFSRLCLELDKTDDNELQFKKVGLVVSCHFLSFYSAVYLMEQFDAFDWLESWERLEVEKVLFGARCFQNAIVLGCGTSALSEQLLNSGMVFGNVVSVDREARCIEIMKSRTHGLSRLEWKVADLCNFHEVKTAINGLNIELAVDKATLDAILCEGDGTGYLLTLNGLLRSGSSLLLVSLHDVEFVTRLLSIWDNVCEAKLMELKFGRSMIFVRQKGDKFLDLSKEAAEQHLKSVMEWYHTEEKPFLSLERRMDLEKGFGGRNLDLEGAFVAMFSPEEREIYTFDLFLQDSVAFHAGNQYSFNDAIRFLEANQ